MWLFDQMSRLERMTLLDGPATALRGVVERIVTNRTVKDALHGVWLGHPLHPGLAQAALGSFLSASTLDALRAGRAESSLLISIGLGAALPTAASGWTDWADSHEDQQRVGLVHAAANGTAVALYAGTLLARRRGHRARALSVSAGLTAGVGALLGGHMGYRQALGANHAEDVAFTGPAAEALETAQERLQVGPGIDVQSLRRVVAVPDLAENPSYRLLWRQVAEAGVRGVLSAPVWVGHQVVGNLNAVTARVHEWSDAEQRAGEAYASLVGQLLVAATRAARRADP